MLAIKIIFWISAILLIYNYLLYPLTLFIINHFTKNPKCLKPNVEFSPNISIIIAAHNEGLVIADKLESIIDGDYPLDKLEILIGSDCSTDNTNVILSEWAEKYPFIKPYFFTERQGKISILNKLIPKANNEILILTDANIIFSKKTISELVIYFSNPKIGFVDSRIINIINSQDDISIPEQRYISLESKIKQYEGCIWGTAMGSFGGCYAIRKQLFVPIPEDKLIMDDLYICMNILKSKYMGIYANDAIVYEKAVTLINTEYRRKIRIAAGAIQNLFIFTPILLKFNILSFCFFSHKVLRWMGPFLLIIIILFSIILATTGHWLYILLASIFILSILISLIDRFILYPRNKTVKIFRFITHFYLANLATFIGWIRVMKGTKNSIWTPTPRA
ncbi:MAG: glycosyltransferase [Bacteroidales bacterium]|jgi:cellulose synthase/poly-beta-1,6-N-acetylglucosamine synthase-like glycosyltransferase|nr:glycosyltransferase [Bacteroidales bacterium]MDI9575312.1 glycosyltransferase [Bacteroidota bacterium]MDY0400590.1 glycosyltransferase [Bacteroidales bacterium]HHW59703.1 glycosyltransferase [Bacteroidales bacterium]HOB78053.1 glycosyltransferase [Bacteroidales bacterium]